MLKSTGLLLINYLQLYVLFSSDSSDGSGNIAIIVDEWFSNTLNLKLSQQTSLDMDQMCLNMDGKKSCQAIILQGK